MRIQLSNFSYDAPAPASQQHVLICLTYCSRSYRTSNAITAVFYPQKLSTVFSLRCSRYQRMELQCDICFGQFDLDHHRPKSLPCGHTICRECVQNPAIGRKCPTCRRNLSASPDDLPDNIFVTRLLEHDAAPTGVASRARRMEERARQLQRGAAAGRKLVHLLRQMVPLAVEALNNQLSSSEAQLQQVEEALEQLRQLQQREAAGEENTTAPLQPAVGELQLAVQMEDSLRLLTANKCSVEAEEDAGAAWRAEVQLGPFDHLVRPLLLQLQLDGHLAKVDAVVAAPPPPPPAALYVGPPRLSNLTIDDVKADDIVRSGRRWRNIRTLNNVIGRDSERLLRVVAPQLEELNISVEVGPSVLEEVGRMPSLRRLLVECSDTGDFPDLPLQLEELAISYPSENQMRCVQRMPRLRSLFVGFYFGAPLPLEPAPNDGLLWLGVTYNEQYRESTLSVIRVFAASVQELQVYTPVTKVEDLYYYHPDLGRDLAACGLRALRRLVLERPSSDPCPETDACLVQRQTARGFLSPAVDVLCGSCHRAVL
ncbi:uncharacterized protein LOC113205871 [Frankliniella occidentalis]|uniref:Uncharacterized protein LOC113205871 n=1 Tax=Frankliniella occidentalis TaxID=133901 RepID=A0A9C6U0K3_FRAOC|nr:uncharacterized protein LOC113205871 [Frankliniella occidentalis]